MSGALYKGGLVKALLKQAVLLGVSSLILLRRRGNAGNLHRSHPVNDLYFEDIYDALKRAEMRNENRQTV